MKRGICHWSFRTVQFLCHSSIYNAVLKVLRKYCLYYFFLNNGRKVVNRTVKGWQPTNIITTWNVCFLFLANLKTNALILVVKDVTDSDLDRSFNIMLLILWCRFNARVLDASKYQRAALCYHNSLAKLNTQSLI